MSSSLPGRMVTWSGRTLARGAWPPLLIFGLNLWAMQKGWYRLWPELDVPMHFLGGVAICCFFRAAHLAALEVRLCAPSDALTTGLLLAGLTTMAALGWEMGEFAVEQLWAVPLQEGVADTLADMGTGLLGGLLVIFMAKAPGPLLDTRGSFR